MPPPISWCFYRHRPESSPVYGCGIYRLVANRTPLVLVAGRPPGGWVIGLRAGPGWTPEQNQFAGLWLSHLTQGQQVFRTRRALLDAMTLAFAEQPEVPDLLRLN